MTFLTIFWPLTHASEDIFRNFLKITEVAKLKTSEEDLNTFQSYTNKLKYSR